MESLEGWATDDHLALLELERRGWRVTEAPWRRPQDWSLFDIVIVRSTWDYQRAPEAFLRVLETIRRSGTQLENSLDTIRWNLRKSYLEELRQKGAPVVPTVWLDAPLDRARLDAARDQLVREWPGGELEPCQELVIKPVISASAEHTYRCRLDALDSDWPALEGAFAERDAMVQPLVPSVLEEGELSLVYFDGTYSHAGAKTPQDGDFRVQEEHGGVCRPTQPEARVRLLADQILGLLDEAPLYARVDLLRAPGDRYWAGDPYAELDPTAPISADEAGWWLMELELVEPSLFLQLHPAASSRFARAITRRVP